MIYLLDTDTLIFVIRGTKSSTRRRVLRDRASKVIARSRDAKSQGDDVAVSAITVSELEYGAHRIGNYAAEIAAVRKVLTPFDFLDYDAVQCPNSYGEIRHQLSAAGKPIGANDTLIAAHALSIPATLITNNVAHFSRIQNLKIENWSK